MKLKNLVAPIQLSCAIFCSAKQDSLSGKWTGGLRQADSTAYPLTYNFTLIGDSVAGTAKSLLGEFPIDMRKLDTAGLHFKVTVNGLDVYHNGTVYADSISLNDSMVNCRLARPKN